MATMRHKHILKSGLFYGEHFAVTLSAGHLLTTKTMTRTTTTTSTKTPAHIPTHRGVYGYVVLADELPF